MGVRIKTPRSTVDNVQEATPLLWVALVLVILLLGVIALSSVKRTVESNK